ncbi:MAG: PD-(D/E)XK nuclease family protein [bacterium]|nr:PD-(D/E)XK nuclease family protein [bacterium]
MTPDKYSAVWVSHTSITDFLQCERAYELKHVYKDPKTNHKIKIMSAPLALGQAVHEVIESLSVLPVKDRFSTILMDRFDESWKKVTGKRGGFRDADSEEQYKKRGREMISRVTKNPGPIARRAVKIQGDLPHYFLSEEDNIILCGKIDWLEYMEDTDSVHIIDFKTGNNAESSNSLQLPIYLLLVGNTQKRPVSKASYWYLAKDEDPIEQELPNKDDAYETILDIAKRMKTARKLGKFKCPGGADGCGYCLPYEGILKGEGEFIFVDTYNTDTYILTKQSVTRKDESVIL